MNNKKVKVLYSDFEFVRPKKEIYITNWARAKAYGFRQYPSGMWYLQLGGVQNITADQNGKMRIYSASIPCIEILCKMYAEGSIKIVSRRSKD